MPNGGPDCCGNCGHNRARQMKISPSERVKFWSASHCTLRDVNITNPFWTYCRNYLHGRLEDMGDKAPAKPIGWVMANGLYEGYVRIPWHGAVEPHVSVPATCSVCERKTDEGIEVMHEGAALGFCTNRHYIQWWRTVHQDDSFDPDNYESPESKYARKAKE